MLSVVIITCNRVNTLLKTIISCYEHCSIDWELIIVDNGSTDGTEEQITKLCEERDISLNYFYSSENMGVAGARNKGYELAKGDVLYFIDDDAFIVSEGNCLDIAYDYLHSSDGTQALSTKIWDELWGGILPEVTEHGCAMEAGVDLRSFIGCSHFIKKDKTISTPLYPHNLFYGGEEIFLSYKIHRAGKKIEYFDKVMVEHHPSKNTRASKYEIYRNRIVNWYVVKMYYYPQPYLLLSYMCYLLRMLKHSKGSISKLMDARTVRKSRYDRTYNDKFTRKEMAELIDKFGYRYLI